jgi:glutamate synthase domain-containing protein 2
MRKQKVAALADLEPLTPAHALVANVDLVIVRWSEDGEEHASVLYGRCHHRGALLADGHIEGENLICGVHFWDYRYKSGISEYNNGERLPRFESWIEDGAVFVDADEIEAWERDNPQPFQREAYQGNYADVHGAIEEPHVRAIHDLATNGLEKVGHHGPAAAMGVSHEQLPGWKDIQFVTAQLSTLPQLDEAEVGTELVIGPNAKKPLRLEIPLFVSDMSFGALSEEAKVALAMGAERAGTGICSGEGGMLPEEQEANSRYFYELASGRFGFSIEKVQKAQAFHFKGGQGAKTGTGGHLPGHKVSAKIAAVRGLEPGQAAISPARFPEWDTTEPIKELAAEVRECTGGIPIGYKLSAQHIERDIDTALEIGVDYVILDGRGGGTGAAPLIFRDHISVPTIPAIARARRHLDSLGKESITLIATGGMRTAPDFAKALALGADGVAVANSALQAIGCLGMRACHTNNCPVGIATQKEHLRARLPVKQGAERLQRFFDSTVELMTVLARACGHTHLNQLNLDDLTTFRRDMSDIAGVRFGGVGAPV